VRVVFSKRALFLDDVVAMSSLSAGLIQNLKDYMGTKRRRIEAEVKANVGLAAVRGDRTTNELVSQFDVHSPQIGQ